MAGTLEALKSIIRSVRDDFQYDDSLVTDDPDVHILDQIHSQPVIAEGSVVKIYAKHPDGKLISEQIYLQRDQLQKKGDRSIELDFQDAIAATGDAFKNNRTALDENDALLDRFEAFIPEKDIEIIRDALLIRTLFRQHKNIAPLKQMMSEQYLSRGTNICNLISSNYYESYIEPMYHHMVPSDDPVARREFDLFYEEAVTQFPFAVFVSTRSDKEVLIKSVLQKIRYNKRSGQHQLNLHGIGKQNTRLITQVINDPRVTLYYSADPDVIGSDGTTFVRIYF